MHNDGMPEEPDLSQAGFEKWFLQRHGEGRWTTLYSAVAPANTGVNLSLFAWLIPTRRTEEALTREGWNCSPGGGAPGLVRGERGEARYLRYGDSDHEFLVRVRDFHKLAEKYCEVSQELIWLFNLWQDPAKKGNLYKILPDGTKEEVIRISAAEVSIRTSVLLQYMAAKQKALVLAVDRGISFNPSAITPQLGRRVREDATTALFVDVFVSNFDQSGHSRMLGKKVILSPPIENCGLWPYELEKTYQEFIIREDKFGRAIQHACDPDVLANNFGANPTAAHYLTPVYFKPSVLTKYYNSPSFEVEDGYLRAGASWGLQIDNNQPGRVAVFLGDLGRDLPETEQLHWKAYNVTPGDYTLSETEIQRSFLGEFWPAEAADLAFKEAYELLNSAWKVWKGWSLFLSPEREDRHVLKNLRIPEGQGWALFDNQIVNLTKLLVDSLNEKELAKGLATLKKEAKGIEKLDTFLRENGYSGTSNPATFLRRIQGLRSRGAAHRRGSDFSAALAGIDESDLPGSFESILQEGMVALESLQKFCEVQSALPGREAGA